MAKDVVDLLTSCGAWIDPNLKALLGGSDNASLPKSRKRKQVEMKAMASYLLRKKGYSLTEIGKELNLNHATIIHHLKIYDSLKQNNPDLQDIENMLLGVKPDATKELQKIIQEKNNKIKFLELKIKEIYNNKQIPRLLALLEHEDIQEKFNAFLNINEKARYYKKYE